jgi:hypothetical protein
MSNTLTLELKPEEVIQLKLALEARIKMLTELSLLASLHCTNPSWGENIKQLSLTCARITHALNRR